MQFFISGLVIIIAGGLSSLFFGRKPLIATILGSTSAVIGSAISLIPSITILITGTCESLRLNWSMPFGSFFIQIDALSALFLIPIFGLTAIAAIYGAQYLWQYRQHKNLGISWFFYNLLLASMALVVTSRNGLLFLISWEIMSLASFFLVTFEYEKPMVRHAGWIYLIATHIGTAFLIIFFILLGIQAGSLDFDKIPAIPSSMESILFILAIIGFGTKAGFMPMHIWLPYAHPAAPSHVSAVMSGVMIKTGIYGLVRALTVLGMPPNWWCWTLIAIGAISGVLGVLFALAQHDLKKLLAYHSVENIGIITLGLGVGLLGMNMKMPALAILGFAGGLFHVINHAVFKGLLFLGAGSVLHATKTGHIDLLGGLIKRMPITGLTFLVGSIAICGLPPLNGFVSEFLIYLGVFKNGLGERFASIIPALVVVGSLSLIGGLALACFTKAFGVIFLGEARSNHAKEAHEAGFFMKISMIILASLCVLLGICSPLIIKSAENVIFAITSIPINTIRLELVNTSEALTYIVIISLFLAGLIVIFSIYRKLVLSARSIRNVGTWDCGYARPDARMQYTAASFAQPLTDLFKMFLGSLKKISVIKDIFPKDSAFHTNTSDLSEKYMYRPLFKWISSSFSQLHWLQKGRLQIYILYIALTLWVLLIWKLM